MKVSNEKINELLNTFQDLLFRRVHMSHMRKLVRDWLSEVEADQSARIAESLLSTDDAMPAFFRKQAE
jgi:hypothetical protein